ncbi:glycosyltransferase family 2 protein [Kineosporia succinea]|uniref:Glycosyltransferase involved in cell wall biosynthesis n=1 Tax=Kineosporia succinea TaxID=84632 RepID=A0ABT9NZV8_9ACTN|nr:glycosyltransferase family A protein [Kineosporia succinea]MDP9825966.1 glycosyltransferase involved in cell wall biosynthesis [Kineosporia succinea]
MSVVIACRNAADTLGIQLEALSRQQYDGEWDVIISDNGSTDHTRIVAQRYMSVLPGLQIVDSSDRAGAGHARNVAAHVSTSDFLAFCDADDEVAEDWLSTMTAALARNPFVAGRFESRKLNSERVWRSRPLQQDTGLQESPFGPGLPHAGAGNMGIKRDVFLAVGGFDQAVGTLEDTDLCWRVQLSGTALIFAPDVNVHVRLRSSFRKMWRQGLNYGHASALLEQRYGSKPIASVTAVTTSLAVIKATQESENARSAGPVAGALKLLRENPSPGALLWAVGWHVGHRAYKDDELPPLPALTASPAPSSESQLRQAG